jgi:hypothetical protein
VSQGGDRRHEVLEGQTWADWAYGFPEDRGIHWYVEAHVVFSDITVTGWLVFYRADHWRGGFQFPYKYKAVCVGRISEESISVEKDQDIDRWIVQTMQERQVPSSLPSRSLADVEIRKIAQTTQASWEDICGKGFGNLDVNSYLKCTLLTRTDVLQDRLRSVTEAMVLKGKEMQGISDLC